MSELSWVGIVIYFLSVAAIVFWSVAATNQLRPRFEPHRHLLRKITIGILVVSAGYWYVTVPYAGRYYDFSNNLAFPENIEADSEKSKYIRDHHSRIESLERELKEQREESRQLRSHYEIVLQLGFYAILFYGSMLVFGNKRPHPRQKKIS